MKDFIEINGIFEMEVWKHNNNSKILIEKYKDDNLIVNLGKNKIIKLLSNDGIDNYISAIQFGTNITSPIITDTAITNPFLKSLDSYNYPAEKTVKFNWSVELNEANGLSIAEYGLTCQDGTLFARKVRSVIEKASDITINGAWSIVVK